jgi:putative ABC transport system substrate-binding protein
VKPGKVAIGPDDTIAAMSDEISRRVFIVANAAAVVGGPRAAKAQTATRVYSVGVISIGAPTSVDEPDWWKPFIDAMRELNYVEGRNLVLTRASAAGRGERLPGLARDLVRANVDIIVTTSTRETRAAKDATSTIPIVMTFVPDPVSVGLVSSLARPGGNVTGLTNLVPGMRQKWVELLKEALPSASRFAVIATPPALAPVNLSEMEAAAKRLGVSLSAMPIHGPDDFEAVLMRARKEGAAGVIAAGDATTIQHRRAFVSLVLKHRLPAIYWAREYVDAGGLMTYSANLVNLRRRAAVYVDKIFKGARPADLPVEQPTTFEFVINLKTAKTLGLTLPPALVLRADQIIE